jgi:hypothetical protein
MGEYLTRLLCQFEKFFKVIEKLRPRVFVYIEGMSRQRRE